MRVAWVHPTWRDLVIEQLADDAALRRHFLRHCGPHGILLALSTAGGAGGERRLPLIGSDEDWDAVGDRLYALIPQLSSVELAGVLTGIGHALDALEPGPPAPEARALAELALTRTSQRCDDAGTAVPLATLEAWFSLARRLRPAVRPPALAVTWAELTPAVSPDPADLAAVRRFTEWLTLCELLRDVPRELRGPVGYGPEHNRLLIEFVDLVATDLDRCANATVVAALEAVATVCPELSSRPARLVPWLRRDIPEPTWLATTPTTVADRELEAAGGYDVSRVLADL
jgi:hypothetical protein